MMKDVFVHPKALCESKKLGSGTRVWAFAHVLPGALIGRDCNICDGVFIEDDVVIGDRVTIKCGVQLWNGLRIESDVFIGPNVTFSNDLFPRSKVYLEAVLPTIVRRGASVGANATILPGLEIGLNAMVGAGSVVTRSVPANVVVTGNPARITGYVDAPSGLKAKSKPSKATRESTRMGPAGLYELPLIKDLRGNLSAGEFEKEIPFRPKRYFMIFDVPSQEIRGEHAHRSCHQFLICIRGSCGLLMDNGTDRKEFSLDRLNAGMYIPPMTWATQFRYTDDAVLLVFASEYYDPDDYIRDYDEFLGLLDCSSQSGVE